MDINVYGRKNLNPALGKLRLLCFEFTTLVVSNWWSTDPRDPYIGIRRSVDPRDPRVDIRGLRLRSD